MRKQRKAFTIVELVIVIAVIAILAAVLIPTFSGVIRRAKVSSDEQTAASLNTYLAAYRVENEIKSEQEIYALIDEAYGAGYSANLTPASASYGYHYWYDSQTGRIVVRRTKEIYSESEGKVQALGVQREGLTKDFGLRDVFGNGCVLLDRAGSAAAEAVSALESLQTGEEYLSVLTVLSEAEQDKNDKDFMVRLQESVQKSVILTDAGAFRYETGAQELVFAPDVKTLAGVVYIYDGTQVEKIALGAASGQTVANVSGEIVLPETVEKVESNALYFGGDFVVLEVSGGKDLETLFDADATDAEIDADGVRYTIEGNALYCEGEKVGELGVSNPIASFSLYIDGKAVGAQVFTEFDKGGVSFTAGGFVGADAQRPVSEQTVIWSVDNEAAADIDPLGNLTFSGAGNANTVTVTATAKYGGASRSVSVNIVRVLGFVLTLNGGTCADGAAVTIDIGADKAYRFEASSFAYNFTGLQEVACDTSLKYECTDAEILTVSEDGVLTPVSVGEAQVTVSLAKYPNVSKTFTVEVADPDAQYFERKFTNFEKYMYRVGNLNPITLSDLFAAGEMPECEGWSVTVYDASKTDGNGKLTPIAQTGNGFTLTVRKNAGLETKNLDELIYKFNGEGVAILEIGAVKGGKVYGKTRLAVEVVNGENITQTNAASLGGGNDVLLSDITLNKGAPYTNATLYGNGFTIDASGYSSSNGKDVIDLTNSDIDNIVFQGKVFPKVVYSGNDYYNNAVNISGGNCTISNSYISGCRSAIRVEGATCVTLENTVLDGGTYANMEIQVATNLYLKDVTTVQTRKTSAEGNDVMGLGFVFDTNAENSNITIEGDLRQYNWVQKDDADILAQYNGSWTDMGLDIGKYVEELFKKDDYASMRHTIDGTAYINTGFLFMGEKAGSFQDDRTNKTEIKYEKTTVKISGLFGIGAMSGTIYTYQSDSPLSGDAIKEAKRFTYAGYSPAVQRAAEAKLIVSEGIATEKPEGAEQYFYYDGTKLHIGVSEGHPFTFDPADSARLFKYGTALTTNVFFEGQPASAVTFTTEARGEYIYTYSAKDYQNYDVYGNPVTGTVKDISIDLQVSVELAKHPNAKIQLDTSNNVLYGELRDIWHLFDPDYYLCVPVLEGLTITDYNADGEPVEILKGDPLNVPANLTITAIAPKMNGGTPKTYGGKYYLCSEGAEAEKGSYSAVVTYSYVGNNGQTVTAVKTFTFTSSTEQVNWSRFE